MFLEEKPGPEWYMEQRPMPRKGQWSTTGNYKMLTRSLFFETADEPDHVLWTLREDARETKDGLWVPSAWLMYIWSPNEYAAALRIVGNLKQWEHLKSIGWFSDYYEQWVEEWKHVQLSAMKSSMEQTVLTGAPGAVTAARTILQMIDGKNRGPGRPSKKASQEPENTEDADLTRMLRAVNGDETGS